jgi:tRNA(fMet)-specific endonuclease VapC
VGLLIDSSVFVDLERAGSAPSEAVERLGDEPVCLAAITASELLHGVHRAESAVRRGRRETFVEAILSWVPVLPFDLEAARAHSRVWADLRRRGELIGAHDMLIAATAIARQLRLLTSNLRHFDRIEGLQIVEW